MRLFIFYVPDRPTIAIVWVIVDYVILLPFLFEKRFWQVSLNQFDKIDF